MEVVVDPADHHRVGAVELVRAAAEQRLDLRRGLRRRDLGPRAHHDVDVLPVALVLVAGVVVRVEEPVLQDELVPRRLLPDDGDRRDEGMDVDRDGRRQFLAQPPGGGALERRLPAVGARARPVPVHHGEGVVPRVHRRGVEPLLQRMVRVEFPEQLEDTAVLDRRFGAEQCQEAVTRHGAGGAGLGAQLRKVDGLGAGEGGAGVDVPPVDGERGGPGDLLGLLHVQRDVARVPDHEGGEAHAQGLQQPAPLVVHAVPRGDVAKPGGGAVEREERIGRRLAHDARIRERHEPEILLPGHLGVLRVERTGDRKRRGHEAAGEQDTGVRWHAGSPFSPSGSTPPC